MKIGRNAPVRGALAVGVALVAIPAAGAAPLASVTSPTPVSAGSGWVVWSQKEGASWRLIAWRAGETRRLAIAGRGVPFDANVGTDRRGRAVVTFSRCVHEPLAPPGFIEEWWTAAGCHVRVVDLATGRERSAEIPRPAGASDTTPSMWHGRVAFARRDRGRRISRVLVFDPTKRRLRALPSGDTGTSTVHAAVEGLDMGSRLVSFLWFVETTDTGHGAWEVVADETASRRSHLVGTGFAGEACASDPDGSAPSTPTTAAWEVTYTQMTSSCFRDTVALVRSDVRHQRFEQAPLEGEVLEASWDGGSGVELIAPPAVAPNGPRCDAAGAPCVVQQVPTPPMTPFSPVFASPLQT